MPAGRHPSRTRLAGITGPVQRFCVLLTGMLCLVACGFHDPAAPAQSHPAATASRVGTGLAPGTGAAGAQFREERAQTQAERKRERGDGWVRDASLPDHRLVLYYGNPFSRELGPIGAYSDGDLLARLNAQGDAYQRLDPSHPVVNGLDYVTPVAQSSVGDGTYRFRMPADSIQHYVDLALSHHLLFFFDLQVGKASPTAELEALWPWLQRPGVNLALDPEFDLNGGGLPGRQIGRMTADEINPVVDRLAALVRQSGGPPKVLVVHQFRPDMLPDRARIHLPPEVALVICADGVGTPQAKIASYALANQPPLQHPGVKLFFTSDRPLMSEAQVLALSPQPLLVMYQ